MWLTKKTGSIFPAAIMHACNNTGAALIGQWLFSGVGDLKDFQPAISQQIVCFIPFVICAAVCTFFMVRERKKETAAPAASVSAET